MSDDHCCDIICNKRTLSLTSLVRTDLLFYLQYPFQHLAFFDDFCAEYACEGYQETHPCLHEAANVSYPDPVGYQKSSACTSDRYEIKSDLLSCLRIQRLLFLSRRDVVLLETAACFLGMDHRIVLDRQYDHV